MAFSISYSRYGETSQSFQREELFPAKSQGYMAEFCPAKS